MIVGVLTHGALLHSVFDLKAAQMNMQFCPIWELMLYKFKQPKIFVVQKVKMVGPKNFTWVTKTSSIRQDQVGLKLWILRPCSKPKRQI